MAKTRVSCPECDATLALDLAALEGKKVRCPKCEAIFVPAVPSNEGFEVVETAPHRRPAGDRPRRFKAKKRGMAAGALVAIIVGSVVLAGALGTGAWLLLGKKDGGTGTVHKDVVPAAGVGINVDQLAQEISGEDIHGTPFKLSDYRGKVVLLDFWGHW